MTVWKKPAQTQERVIIGDIVTGRHYIKFGDSSDFAAPIPGGRASLAMLKARAEKLNAKFTHFLDYPVIYRTDHDDTKEPELFKIYKGKFSEKGVRI